MDAWQTLHFVTDHTYLMIELMTLECILTLNLKKKDFKLENLCVRIKFHGGTHRKRVFMFERVFVSNKNNTFHVVYYIESSNYANYLLSFLLILTLLIQKKRSRCILASVGMKRYDSDEAVSVVYSYTVSVVVSYIYCFYIHFKTISTEYYLFIIINSEMV